MKLPLDHSFVILGIDQSLTGTGLAVVKATFPELKTVETRIVSSKLKGFSRIEEILMNIKGLVATHQPSVIAMEDYTRMANSASLAPLIELASCIKLDLFRLGLEPVIQNQSSMKKFAFGDGGTQKDSSYLLRVFDITGQRFPDDNQADAFLHAWLMVEKIWYATGKRNIDDLTAKQRDTLMAMGQKESKLSEAKFRKLTAHEKLNWFLRACEVELAA